MPRKERTITIVVADDDPDDRELLRQALTANRLTHRLIFVEDGEALMAHLRQHMAGGAGNAPRPDLILLDLNMPRKDGREALAEIKADPNLRAVPVIVLTTSDRAEDISRSYESGANSFIKKPATFEELVAIVRSLSSYWFKTTELPPTDS
ncbi:MAG: response regulator [Planctomycetota bacterium]|jgi:CheY-like chemotaxis protein